MIRNLFRIAQEHAILGAERSYGVHSQDTSSKSIFTRFLIFIKIVACCDENVVRQWPSSSSDGAFIRGIVWVEPLGQPVGRSRVSQCEIHVIRSRFISSKVTQAFRLETSS